MAKTDGFKTGIVESIDDPTYHGRIKVRIKGYNDNVDTENLPWCTYGGSAFFSGNGGGSISVPRVGQNVRVRFKKDDPNSMEWYGTNRIDKDLAIELADDYEGSQVILFDSDADLSLMYKNATGFRIYHKGSFIQLSPDNNITIHYGEGNTGVQIQLSDGKIDIQGNQQINITSGNIVNVEANSVNLMGSESVSIKGDHPNECAVNANELFKVLMNLARLLDQKIPATAGMAANVVQASKNTIMNQAIKYV